MGQVGFTHRKSFVGFHRHRFVAVEAAFELVADGFERLDRELHVVERVGCRRDQAQDDFALRDHRIDHYRAEEVVFLAQIDDQVGRFGDAAFHIDGGYGRLGYTDFESVLLQSALQGTGDFPELLLVFGVLADQIQTLQRADHHRHRE